MLKNASFHDVHGGMPQKTSMGTVLRLRGEHGAKLRGEHACRCGLQLAPRLRVPLAHCRIMIPWPLRRGILEVKSEHGLDSRFCAVLVCQDGSSSSSVTRASILYCLEPFYPAELLVASSCCL